MNKLTRCNVVIDTRTGNFYEFYDNNGARLYRVTGKMVDDYMSSLTSYLGDGK